MKFERYDNYKDSEIDSLSEVPSEWGLNRIKYISHIQYSNVDKKSYEGQKEIFLCNYVDVYKNEYIDKSINFMKSTASEEEIKKFTVEQDDVLFTKDSESFDDNVNPCLINENLKNVICGYHLALVRPNKNKLIGKYLFRALQSVNYNYYFAVNSKGITRVGLGLNIAKDSKIYLPPLDTQLKIVNFIDKKTQKVDNEISLLEQKIKKYQELKQTLIKETVLRGLDKDVELKDSGTQWIGNIPKHWEIKRVKDIFNVSRGRVIAQTDLIDNGLYPVYSSQTENNGCLGYINTWDFNTSLITWTTDGVNAGTVFLRHGKFNCTNICGTLKLVSKQSSLEYLKYAVQMSTIHNKRIDTNGAKIMSNEMKIIPITIAPIKEQEAIANYLNEKTTKIDEIVKTIGTKIKVLKEFRKTLINDVVTGKVKVA